eukprot:933915_1
MEECSPVNLTCIPSASNNIKFQVVSGSLSLTKTLNRLMATQEQLAALQQILEIAQKAGLNQEEQKLEATPSNTHSLDEFNRNVQQICESNTNTTFLICCNIETNEKYSPSVGKQLSNNVLSSIASVTTQFAQYDPFVYKLTQNKTAILVTLKDNDHEHKTQKIKIIKDIASAIKDMVFGACGCDPQSVSFAISSRKNNEDASSFTSRTDLLLDVKTKHIAYDVDYFEADDLGYNDAAFNVNGNEIITICVGGAGTNIGHALFDTMMAEHNLEEKTGAYNTYHSRLDKINTYFDTNKDHKSYRPRCVMIDLDSDNLDKIKDGYLGSLIETEHFCCSSSKVDTNHYWPQGHYTAGKEMFYNIKDTVRHVVETCDHLQGFNYIHSLGGGTGGGLTTLIQAAFREDYPSKTCANFCIYPSRKEKDENALALSHYNSLLSLKALQKKTDLLFPICNDKLASIAENSSFEAYNWWISLVLCGVTSPFRFYGEPEIASTMQKMYMSFGIFPGAVHLGMAHAPFIPLDRANCTELSAAQIKQHLLSKMNHISCSAKVDMMKGGKLLQHTVIYKSNNQSMIRDLDDRLRSLSNELADYKSEIDPMPFQSSLIYNQCEFYDEYTPIIATSIVHSTAIHKEYKLMKAQFKSNFNQQKMLSSFYDQGMDSYEFIEADKHIDALIVKYNKLQDKTVKLEEDDDEEEEEEEDEEEEDDDEDY